MDLDNFKQQLQAFGTDYGIQVLGALVILIAGKLAAGVARRSLRRLLGLRKVDPSVVSFVSSLAYFTILTVAILAALSKFGIQTTSFIAVLGAAGFAVGLALQGSLGNFAAGVLILLLRPYRVGDYIRGGGTEGQVKDIHLFVTELATLDNIKVLVPNGSLFAGNIEVLTGYQHRRVVCPIGVSYGTDLGKAREVALEVMKADPRTLDAPASDVVVTDWGDSSVNLAAVCWVKPTDYWGVFFAMNRELKEAFDANQIEIPFPQRVVHTKAA